MTDPRINALCRWFDRTKRDLPWRRQRTGYTALVAEAMLQQTQVTRVIDRFEAFITALPDVHALAAADEQVVMRLWNGLGYYRRARNLHAAAKHVVEQCDGEVPMDVSLLRDLPGVGRYTAGAIASIVGEQHEPIVDGNVQRVLQRWTGDTGDPRDRETVSRCWTEAARLVCQAKRPGVFNEALMELGALICTPKSPACDSCPVAKWCSARQQNLQNEIPPARRVAPTPTVYHHVVICLRDDRVLLEQRDRSGLWAGLWQPPTVEAEHRLQRATIDRRLPFRASDLRRADEFEFQTSSKRVVFRTFTATTRIRRGHWQSINELNAIAMSNAHRRVLSRVLQVELPAH